MTSKPAQEIYYCLRCGEPVANDPTEPFIRVCEWCGFDPYGGA